MKLNPANIERKGFKELSGPNRLILKGAFNCYLWGKYHCSSYPWNHGTMEPWKYDLWPLMRLKLQICTIKSSQHTSL